MKLALKKESTEPIVTFALEEDSGDIEIMAILPDGEKEAVAYFDVDSNGKIMMYRYAGLSEDFFRVDKNGKMK